MKHILYIFFAVLALSCTRIIEYGDIVFVSQTAGPKIGVNRTSGVSVLREGGKCFKDIDKDGKLDDFEDWRLSPEQRAMSLASELTVEQMVGLSLHSTQQQIPYRKNKPSYSGLSYAESNVDPWTLTDIQKECIVNRHMRHFLIKTVESVEVAVKWNNSAQALAESGRIAIPLNNSSDPRHSLRADPEFTAGGGNISMWPEALGLAATFDVGLQREYADVVAKELRALGMTTFLGPQIDLGTEPRWFRYSCCMGESPDFVTAAAREFCDALQTTEGSDNGWGTESVVAMAKHWPGGGSCEAGRDAHYGSGKYAVYPGGNYELGKRPFEDGALALPGKTLKAAAIMPYYSIPFGVTGKNLGQAFDEDIISVQLRDSLDYDELVCTDWMITDDYKGPGVHYGKPWGMESATKAERFLLAWIAGCDQFGGNMDYISAMEGYKLGVQRYGEEFMTGLLRKSSERILRNMFRLGLFENPYLVVEESEAVVAAHEFCRAGYEAQKRSVVMLKNRCLPLAKGLKLYVPDQIVPAHMSYWNKMTAVDTLHHALSLSAEMDYDIVSSSSEADAAVVFINAPMPLKGYDNGYVPKPLQYSPYVASSAREHSIAGGDPYEKGSDRGYRGKSAQVYNSSDLDLVRTVRDKMGDRPVVLVVQYENPFVPAEIEPYADAILLVSFVQHPVVMEIIKGDFEPSGKLPCQLPADMETVEMQYEDTPFDMECYKDSDGNVYDYSFGLSWKGII